MAREDRKPWKDHLGELQQTMLSRGARMSALDSTGKQNWQRRGNNKDGGAHSHRHQGERMTTRTTVSEEKNKTVETDTPPPAGGSEATTYQQFLRDLRSLQSKPISRTALEVAVPTGIVAAGIIVVYGATTLIRNKWGGPVAPAAVRPMVVNK